MVKDIWTQAHVAVKIHQQRNNKTDVIKSKIQIVQRLHAIVSEIFVLADAAVP